MLENRLRRQWQITRDHALKAVANRLQRSVSRRLNECRKDQCSATPETLDPEDESLWRMTKLLMRVPTPLPLLITPGRLALSDSEKAEALADNLETQFQPVTVPSVPAVIEVVDVALRSYFISPASETQLTALHAVHAAIRDLNISKAPCPNCIPNRVMKHRPKRAVSFLAHVYNAVIRSHHFPQAWKHARVISILKPGKGLALPSSYRPLVFWTRLVN